MSASWINKYDLICYNSIDSTNLEAIRIIKDSGRDNVLIWAKKQTTGFGKQKSKWESKEGNLYMSILSSHNFDIKKSTQIPFIIANNIYDSIKTLISNEVENDDLNPKIEILLKWPNDVLINGKKVCGILCHSLNYLDKIYIIIGIGINVYTMPDYDFATTLKDEKINVQNLEEILDLIMINFDISFSKWKNDGDFLKIKSTWTKRAYKINEELELIVNNKKTTGIFKGIYEDGSMKLLLPDGVIKCINLSDVF